MKWLRRRIIASIATQTAETFAVIAVLAFALMQWRTDEGPLTALFGSVVIAQLVACARLGHAMRNNPLNYLFMRRYVEQPFTYRVTRFQGEDDAHPVAQQLPGFAPVATIRDSDADPEPVFDVYHDPSRLVAASVSRASGSIALISSLADGRILVTDARVMPPHERLVMSLASNDSLDSVIATHRRAISARTDVVELASSAHQVVLDSLAIEYDSYLSLGPALSAFLDLEPAAKSWLRLVARIKPDELVDLPTRLGPDAVRLGARLPEVQTVATPVTGTGETAAQHVPKVVAPDIPAPTITAPDIVAPTVVDVVAPIPDMTVAAEVAAVASAPLVAPMVTPVVEGLPAAPVVEPLVAPDSGAPVVEGLSTAPVVEPLVAPMVTAVVEGLSTAPVAEPLVAPMVTPVVEGLSTAPVAEPLNADSGAPVPHTAGAAAGSPVREAVTTVVAPAGTPGADPAGAPQDAQVIEPAAATTATVATPLADSVATATMAPFDAQVVTPASPGLEDAGSTGDAAASAPGPPTTDAALSGRGETVSSPVSAFAAPQPGGAPGAETERQQPAMPALPDVAPHQFVTLEPDSADIATGREPVTAEVPVVVVQTTALDATEHVSPAVVTPVTSPPVDAPLDLAAAIASLSAVPSIDATLAARQTPQPVDQPTATSAPENAAPVVAAEVPVPVAPVAAPEPIPVENIIVATVADPAPVAVTASPVTASPVIAPVVVSPEIVPGPSEPIPESLPPSETVLPDFTAPPPAATLAEAVVAAPDTAASLGAVDARPSPATASTATDDEPMLVSNLSAALGRSEALSPNRPRLSAVIKANSSPQASPGRRTRRKSR